MKKKSFNRRDFINVCGVSFAAGALMLPGQLTAKTIMPDGDNINHIGPMEGYTPQIGTLISMLDWVSDSVIRATKNLSVEQLDHVYDKDSNSIGSLMMHVAATEVIYQDITFDNLSDFKKENKDKWKVAMDLGEDARVKIKGNNVAYYVALMNEVRVNTKQEMKKRNDEWLLSGETKEWNWNNYCKWFHVTEHFANHRGQMTWYIKRLTK